MTENKKQPRTPARKSPAATLSEKQLGTETGFVLPEDWERLQALKRNVDQKIQELSEQQLAALLAKLKEFIEIAALDPAQVIESIAKEFHVDLLQLATRKTKRRTPNQNTAKMKTNWRDGQGFELGAHYRDPENPQKIYIAKKSGRIPGWVVELLDGGKSWGDLRIPS